ncbi:Saposin A-type domain [Trinorchestia longiramus]|nr:Saposin A-type domain [Trinorchestia longiramus]
MGVMTLWTVLFGLSLVSGAKLLGTSECTYGPAFWCGSLRNAKQCSAVTECIHSTWENQQLPEDNDDICAICKNMVQEARDTLKSNQTQEELKQVLEGSCRLIPLPEISDECVQFADEFIPELIETLTSEMNPQVVCASAGLCNSIRIDRMLREHGISDSAHQPQAVADSASVLSSDCDDCRKFVTDVIKNVRSHSKQEVMNHLLEICGELGSVSDGCSGLVSVNIDVIYNFLAFQLQPNDACQLFGMCGNLFGGVAEAKKAVSKTGDEACDFCVVIAQHWKNVLTTNTSEEEFRQVLEGLCMQTGSFKDECLGLVDNYGLAAYNWLLNEFDPKQVCEVVGICGHSEDKAVWTVLHVDPAPADMMLSEGLLDKSSLKFVGDDEANSYRLEAEPAELPRVHLTPSIKISVAGESGLLPSGKQACTMCEFTLHFIQVQLQDQHTKEEIEDVVKSVCRHLPQNVREQCDDYVDAYGDQVIALLQQEIDPSIVCPMLGLCPGASVTAVLTDTTAPRVDVSCVGCEFIMTKVKEILEDKRDQESVREALDKVCGLLPRSLSNECQTFVDENAIEVMQLLAGGVQPEQICHMLGLCPKLQASGALQPLDASHQLPISRLFVPSSLPQRGSSSDLRKSGQSKVCVLCEFAVSLFDKTILNNSTGITERIVDEVERMCLRLPSTLVEDCVGFIEQYGTALVQLIVNGVDPSVVCRQLHVCKQPAFLGLPHAIAKRSASNDEERCLICKAVSNVDSSSPDAVRDFCMKLATEHQQTCLDVNVEDLTAATADGSSNTQACASLGYCPAPTSLIGSEKCTWGPSYWCQTLLHAQSCGATPHCEERVWAAAAPAN